MLLRRLLTLAALLMIGDALIALIHPRRYLRLWEIGPDPIQDLLESLREKPELVRALAVSELAAGLWLALRETNE